MHHHMQKTALEAHDQGISLAQCLAHNLCWLARQSYNLPTMPPLRHDCHVSKYNTTHSFQMLRIIVIIISSSCCVIRYSCIRLGTGKLNCNKRGTTQADIACCVMMRLIQCLMQA